MTPTQRRASIVVVWVIVAAAVLRWIVTWPVPDTDDYSTWFLINIVFFAGPWIMNLIMILGICLSLERRASRAKLCIISIWALCLVCPVFVSFIQIQTAVRLSWWRSIFFNLDLFGYPWLFKLLLILCVAMGIEATVNFVKELRQRG